MDKVTLEVQTRELDVNLKTLRSQKLIPAVFYGKGEKNIHLQMDYQTFRRHYMKSGSQLIDLLIDGSTNKKAIVQEVQYDPLTGQIVHVDFLRVSLKESINVSVEIEVVGVAPAVKDLGGILNQIRNEVEVKCLPTAIPKSIEVDVTSLIDFSSAIYVKDLIVPKGVEVLDDPEEVVVIVNAPRVEEVVDDSSVESVEGEGATGSDDSADDKNEENKD